jgi:hypothetical protein
MKVKHEICVRKARGVVKIVEVVVVKLTREVERIVAVVEGVKLGKEVAVLSL